jgi:hypothetical protein
MNVDQEQVRGRLRLIEYPWYDRWVRLQILQAQQQGPIPTVQQLPPSTAVSKRKADEDSDESNDDSESDEDTDEFVPWYSEETRRRCPERGSHFYLVAANSSCGVS